MGSFERFKTKTHFNSLKRLVGVTALAALAVKLLTVALATAAGGGTPLDLLARVPACVADLGSALLVFEVLRTRRPLQLAARSAILVAVSPVLFVASGIHGDRVGVAVALLLLAMYLLVERDAPLVAGITLAIASRVEPMALLAAPVAMAVITGRAVDDPDPRAGRSRLVHFGGALAGGLFAAWVPTLAWGWDSLAPAPGDGTGPGGLGPGWVLARSLDQGLAGWLLGSGRPLVLAVAVLPAVIWVRRRPRRVYAAVGLVLLAPLALGPAWSPRDLVWPAVFGYLGDARWASIYAVAAGATLLWTSTWWGAGIPWHGGVDPALVPAGSVAGLGLITWVVLGSWVVLGWRTVAVEAAAGPGSVGSGVLAEPMDDRGTAAPRSPAVHGRGVPASRPEAVDNRGARAARSKAVDDHGARAARSEAVDNRGARASRSATLPPGGLDPGPGGSRAPLDGPAGNSPAGNGPAGNGPAGNGPAGNGLAADGPGGAGQVGAGPGGDGPAGDGLAGNGLAGNGPGGIGALPNGPAGNGPAGNGLAGNGLGPNGSAAGEASIPGGPAVEAGAAGKAGAAGEDEAPPEDGSATGGRGRVLAPPGGL